jgi:hypothetical protein
MSVAGRIRRGPTVTSYHVQPSDGQELTVIADAEVFGPTGFARVHGSEGLRFGSLRARPTAGINRRVHSGRRLVNEFVKRNAMQWPRRCRWCNTSWVVPDS